MKVREDMHIRTTFSDGLASVEDVVARAEHLGLQRICIVDRVRRTTDWLGEWQEAIWRARDGREVEVRLGVAAQLLDINGELDLPPLPMGIDHIFVADQQWPLIGCVVPPAEIRRRIGRRVLDPRPAVALLLEAYRAAICRYRRVTIAQPFSILPRVGLSEDWIDSHDLDFLIETMLTHRARIEVNERWCCPNTATLATFLAAGVPYFHSSGSHRLSTLGQFGFVSRTCRTASLLAQSLPRPSLASLRQAC